MSLVLCEVGQQRIIKKQIGINNLESDGNTDWMIDWLIEQSVDWVSFKPPTPSHQRSISTPPFIWLAYWQQTTVSWYVVQLSYLLIGIGPTYCFVRVLFIARVWQKAPWNSPL